MSGGASLFLWPWLLRSGLVSDLAALLVGAASLGIASAALAASPTAVVLWACLILGTVAVGLLRTLPASLATKAAAPSRRGEVLGRLDAAGSACRVIAPAITGLLIDAAGLQAAFAAQAARSASSASRSSRVAGGARIGRVNGSSEAARNFVAGLSRLSSSVSGVSVESYGVSAFGR